MVEWGLAQVGAPATVMLQHVDGSLAGTQRLGSSVPHCPPENDVPPALRQSVVEWGLAQVGAPATVMLQHVDGSLAGTQRLGSSVPHEPPAKNVSPGAVQVERSTLS